MTTPNHEMTKQIYLKFTFPIKLYSTKLSKTNLEISMGLFFSKIQALFDSFAKESRVLMIGLDAAGKTTVLNKVCNSKRIPFSYLCCYRCCYCSFNFDFDFCS
jgi:hypothetical protein